jgi:hypothetical protein
MAISTAGANAAVSGTLAAPVALARGWYWVCALVDNAVATFSIVTAAGTEYPFLIGNATLANAARAGASQYTGFQTSDGIIQYSTGFVPVGASAFNVVSGQNIALYFKVQ